MSRPPVGEVEVDILAEKWATRTELRAVVPVTVLASSDGQFWICCESLAVRKWCHCGLAVSTQIYQVPVISIESRGGRRGPGAGRPKDSLATVSLV